ncbi:DUF4339 domain-containing protein [Akkermansiaceae bacterium]|nr:DUF4339 domain-containing protein [Akkermansiaceae bacterium]
MILWIIKDGEKSGPLEDYEVREMIREGKVDRDTRVWHDQNHYAKGHTE